jgi:hypothetical protein
MVAIKNVRVPINYIFMHGLWCKPPVTFHLTFELGVQLCCVTLTMSRKKNVIFGYHLEIMDLVNIVGSTYGGM